MSHRMSRLSSTDVVGPLVGSPSLHAEGHGFALEPVRIEGVFYRGCSWKGATSRRILSSPESRTDRGRERPRAGSWFSVGSNSERREFAKDFTTRGRFPGCLYLVRTPLILYTWRRRCTRKENIERTK